MELAKISKDEIKGFDVQRSREVEVDIRRNLAMIKMDLYTDQKQHTGIVRGLKKTLARVLTARNELLRNQSK